MRNLKQADKSGNPSRIYLSHTSKGKNIMSETIALHNDKLKKIRDIDERLVSYNIEMTEVTGGTFWKKYTPRQIAGTEKFPAVKDFGELSKMMQVYPPADLYNEKLRRLAGALGSVYVRVSGSWATKTYYDFDGHTNGKAPQGYQSVLTREQWNGVLDFVKAVDAKLLISVSNCEGDHVDGKPWTPEQAKLLFDYSRDYGVPIAAAEFMNEPNVMEMAPPVKGYGPQDFGRDQDAFFRFIRENYPDVLLVGPCACGDSFDEKAAGAGSAILSVSTEEMLSWCKEPADVFSYHCYAGISERGASLGGHWDAKDALGERYLKVPENAAKYYAKIRDEHCPDGQMWVTESADAGLGGNTWASTYLDVIRSADELARFALMTDGIIFHNTLASSDYGYLDRDTHSPRPNYWLVYLWNHLMGTAVFDTGEETREGCHLYAHSRRDQKEGYAYLAINNSQTDSLCIDVETSYDLWLLDAPDLRSGEIRLNGNTLCASENGEIAALYPEKRDSGTITIPPAALAFIIV